MVAGQLHAQAVRIGHYERDVIEVVLIAEGRIEGDDDQVVIPSVDSKPDRAGIVLKRADEMNVALPLCRAKIAAANRVLIARVIRVVSWIRGEIDAFRRSATDGFNYWRRRVESARADRGGGMRHRRHGDRLPRRGSSIRTRRSVPASSW